MKAETIEILKTLSAIVGLILIAMWGIPVVWESIDPVGYNQQIDYMEKEAKMRECGGAIYKSPPDDEWQCMGYSLIEINHSQDAALDCITSNGICWSSGSMEYMEINGIKTYPDCFEVKDKGECGEQTMSRIDRS